MIAHEIGHHVQNLLGVSDKVDSARRRVGEAQANQLSVRMELQADCLAGVWAATAQRANQQLLEPGDVEEGLKAAAAIGDDRLQRQSQGYVVPEALPTAPASSACAGCAAALSPAISASAIPSPRATCNRGLHPRRPRGAGNVTFALPGPCSLSIIAGKAHYDGQSPGSILTDPSCRSAGFSPAGPLHAPRRTPAPVDGPRAP